MDGYDKTYSITISAERKRGQHLDAGARGAMIYFAHPYSSCERPVNERTNRVLRKFVLKGKSITAFTTEDILIFFDEINSTPTRRLDYHTSEELFEAELDRIYCVN